VLPQFDRRYLLRTARNLAAALSALHSSGYVAGDLNESNVLVTPTALVTLIDTDSFQVEEQRDSRAILHPCPVGKLEYIPPELQNKPLGMFHRLPEQDSFGLGVLIFQLLMEGNHPFRAQWLGGGDPPPVEARIAQGAFPYTASPSYPVRPPKNAPDLNMLHPEIAELVRRCFVDGAQKPNLRPSPGMWERAIAEAEKVLELDPDFPGAHHVLGSAYWSEGKRDDAFGELERAVELSGRHSFELEQLGVRCSAAGMTDRAGAILKELEAKYESSEALGRSVASLYAALGDKEQAFAWLEKDFQNHSGPLPEIAFDPEETALRKALSDDPRWSDLLRRIGLQS
jgi:serine/threonine protein kinase